MGRLRGLPLDEVQDRAREHSELRVERLRAEIEGSDDAADGPARRVGRVERAREHLPPNPAALSTWEREELREEVRPSAEDRDGIAYDLAPHDGDMESPWIGSERVAEELDEVPRGKVRRWFSLAASQVPQRTDAHAGAGGEVRRARGANADIL